MTKGRWRCALPSLHGSGYRQAPLALRSLGFTREPTQAISEIVHARKRITADTALDFEVALGISARFWLNLQTTYDLALAKQRRTA